MKKIKLLLGLIMLALTACTPLEKKQSGISPVLPNEAIDEVVSIIPEAEFIFQTDIIHTNQNVPLAKNIGTESESSEVEYINIAQKQIRNKLAYNENSTTPFTGTFAALVGDFRHYTEEYRDGKLNGYKIWYSEAGRIGMKEPYLDGKKTGVQETYYRNNGSIRSKITYSLGKVSGEMSWYDNNGELVYQENFKGGSGEWRSYWDNGQIKEKGRLSNGLSNGEWRYFTEKGEIEKITIFKNGSPKSQEWFK